MRNIFKMNPILAFPLLILGLSLFSFSQQLSASVTLKVGLPIPGQVPFMWTNDKGEVVGIYADVIRTLAKETKVDIEFVSLSQARLVKHFIAGEIDIEMGVSLKQNENVAITKVSVFSQSFGFANDVVIYNKSYKFPAFILQDLKGRKVAAVRGIASPAYIVREDFASPLQIAKRVNRGWSELGLMREAPAMHYKFNQGMSYKISLPYQSNPIVIRLHQRNKELLPEINSAIMKFKTSGKLDDILCDYLCGD